MHISYIDCTFVTKIAYKRFHTSECIPIFFALHGTFLSFSKESRASNINSQLNEDGGSVKDAVNKTLNFHIF